MYRRVSPRIASHRFNILTNLDNCFHLQLKCRCMRRTRLPMGTGWEWHWRGKAVKISHQLKLKLLLDDGQGRGRQWQLCSSSSSDNNCNGEGNGNGKGTHLSAVHASISRLPSFLLFCVLCQIKKEIKMNIFWAYGKGRRSGRRRGLAECECICMLRVSHCAHFIFHSRHCCPLPLARHAFC